MCVCVCHIRIDVHDGSPCSGMDASSFAASSFPWKYVMAEEELVGMVCPLLISAAGT